MASESTVQRIFDDLLNLEVDLILKADMTARKMPMTGEAVADVAVSYDSYLDRQAGLLGTPRTHAIAGRPISAEVFTGLGTEAEQLRVAIVEQDSPEDVVLKRVERNSAQLARIFRDLGPMESDQRWVSLESVKKEDLLILRKAWEVSTEKVIMQTVAQVDGDIVTRLQPAYANADHAPVHAVHAQLVTTALEQWRFMFAAVATLTISTFQSFF